MRTVATEVRGGVGDGSKRLAHPSAQRVAPQIGERVEAYVLRMSVVVQLHRRDERGVSFGAASTLAAAAILNPDNS